MIRRLPLGLLAVLLAPPALGQEPPDTVLTQQVTYFGTGLTYAEIQHEYARLQRLPEPEDTTATDDPDAGIQRLEIDGLVVDETLTKLGRDFYDVFFRAWEPPRDAINFTIGIQEQPAPGIGTIVSVTVNDEVVFQARLQPQPEQVELAARQAAYYAYERLKRGEQEIVY
ncbi:MAG TPA: CsgE family curli-type amyloid fiber assembly protein [Rubricoccaceae bacterium]|nr:CsgE family curli-type amyloid fiber assembly protein [Rubricoccaceae bacterium]